MQHIWLELRWHIKRNKFIYFLFASRHMPLEPDMFANTHTHTRTDMWILWAWTHIHSIHYGYKNLLSFFERLFFFLFVYKSSECRLYFKAAKFYKLNIYWIFSWSSLCGERVPFVKSFFFTCWQCDLRVGNAKWRPHCTNASKTQYSIRRKAAPSERERETARGRVVFAKSSVISLLSTFWWRPQNGN